MHSRDASGIFTRRIRRSSEADILDVSDGLPHRQFRRLGEFTKKLREAVRWQATYHKATFHGCELKNVQCGVVGKSCQSCPFISAPKLGKQENEIFQIWKTVNLPVVQAVGLQNILSACEIQREEWNQSELEAALSGLQSIYEALCEIAESKSAPQS